MAKRIIYIFIISFVLNFISEYFQSGLYESYMGEKITNDAIMNFALFNSALITLIYYVFEKVTAIKNRWWLMALILFFIAVALELNGLKNQQFEYTENMPTMTAYGIGIFPTVGLAILGYFSALFTKKLARSTPKKSDDSKSSRSSHRRSYYYGRNRRDRYYR